MRDDATKTNGTAWTEWRRLIRADAEREECGRVLPRAEVLRVAFLLVEVQVAESPANLPGDSRIEVRLQNGRSLVVGRGFDPKHVRELTVFTRDGAVPIDNNVSEREMKRVVLNRKNSLFVETRAAEGRQRSWPA